MRRPTGAGLRAFAMLVSIFIGMLLFSIPLSAQYAKSQAAKSEQAKSDKAKSQEAKLSTPGVFGGKVLDVGEDGKSLLLRVYGQTPKFEYTPGNPASC